MNLYQEVFDRLKEQASEHNEGEWENWMGFAFICLVTRMSENYEPSEEVEAAAHAVANTVNDILEQELIVDALNLADEIVEFEKEGDNGEAD